ncbi:MAG: HypC/HybG/HupF family hydrogenase formation chaperone [Armatimonadota bacterium]|nr:HypC/HybG/HupF family hydrogenase formation chaperone [Armatimonadota bacterium]
MCLAVPYRLVEIRGPGRALAEGPDGVREISTELLDAPAPGTYVLVAYGAAVREIDPADAAQLRGLLAAMQAASEDLP